MRKVIVVAILLLLSGCGGSDGPENCRYVQFIPELGDSYYEYTCDDHADYVRYIPEVPQHE